MLPSSAGHPRTLNDAAPWHFDCQGAAFVGWSAEPDQVADPELE